MEGIIARNITWVLLKYFFYIQDGRCQLQLLQDLHEFYIESTLGTTYSD